MQILKHVTCIFVVINAPVTDRVSLLREDRQETDLPGQGAVQYGDEEALGGVEGGEDVSQEERRSTQEHQA